MLDPFIPYVAAFFFVFAIVLGLLESANLFNKNKRVNAVIAAVFGIFSAMYEPFVAGMQTYLPIAAGILIIIFFVVLLKKLFGGKKDGSGKSSHDSLPMVVVLISLLLVLISQWDLVKNFLPASWDATAVGWILAIIVILIVFWAVYKHKPE